MFSIPLGEISLLPALGYALMLFAAYRLARFEAVFERMRRVLLAALPIGVILLSAQIYKSAAGDGVFAGFDIAYAAVEWADELIEMAVMFFFYIGVKIMGERADIPALVKHSTRNMTVMAVYLVLEAAVALLTVLAPQVFEGFAIIRLYPIAAGVIWRVLNLWTIFTCYLGLARDDGEKPEPEPSGASRRKKRKRK